MAYTFLTPVETALADGTHDITNVQVPAQCFASDNLANLQWNEDTVVFPEDPTKYLLTPRGADHPDLPWLSFKNRKTHTPMSKCQGTAVFHDDTPDGVSPARFLFGGPDETMEAGRFRFAISLNSQAPYLAMDYKGPKQGDEGFQAHRVHLHGNSSMKDVFYTSPTSILKGELAVPVPLKHEKAAEEGRLVAITIQFGQSLPRERHMNSVTVSHDKFTTKTGSADRWSSDNAMISTLTRNEPLQGFDNAVHAFFTTHNFRVVFFREFPLVEKHHMPSVDLHYNYWAHLMRLSIQHGCFWFYRLQPSFSKATPGAFFLAWEKPNCPPPVPFWLVKKFRIAVKDKLVTALIPMEWDSITPDMLLVRNAEFLLPSPSDATLLQELSIVRGKAYEHVLNSATFSGLRVHPMKITKLAELGSRIFFRVDISVVTSVDEGSESKEGIKLLPSAGSSMDVKLGTDTNTRSKSLRGRVVDEPSKGPDVDLVLHCDASRSQADEIMSQFKDGRLETHGIPTVRSNFESADRMLEGFRGVARDIPNSQELLAQRGAQPDGRSILLKYPPRFDGPIPGLNVDQALHDFGVKIGREIQSISAACEALELNLNASQSEAVRSAIMGGKGKLTAIIGPPGTGKSHTMAALIVLLHFVFGCKVVVTASSNQACEAIMEKVVDIEQKTLRRLGLELKCVRFIGQNATPMEAKATESAGYEELQLRRQDQWKSELRYAGYSIHEAKKQLVKTLQSLRAPTQAQKELLEVAKLWLSNLQKSVDGLLFGDAKKEHRSRDNLLATEVLENHCGVLVGTLNSMGRTALARAFAANTLIIDEAGQAPLGDMAIPFNTFETSLARVVLGGDYQQLPPYFGSERANEATNFAKTAVFKDICFADDKYDVRLLNQQYRCHPAIYNWSNKTFYDGKVLPGGGVEELKDVDKVVLEFMQQQLARAVDGKGKLKWDANNPPRVIGIDINASSQTYPGTTSAWNPAETEFAMWLNNALLAFKPAQGGEELTPEQITVISPYTGQVQAIKDKKQDKGLVSTVAKSQGSECVIGISLFAKNVYGKIGYIGFVWVPSSLNVWFSRQKRFHFITGNWTTRHSERANLKMATNDNATYIKLLAEVCDGSQPGTVVLQPSDFKDWPGFSVPIGPASSRKDNVPSSSAVPEDRFGKGHAYSTQAQEQLQAQMAGLTVSDSLGGAGFQTFRPQDYGPGPSRAAMAPPLPPNYVCYRCGKLGHHIKDCPTNGDPAFDKKAVPRPSPLEGNPLEKYLCKCDKTPGHYYWECPMEREPAIDPKAPAPDQGKGKEEAPPLPPNYVCHRCGEPGHHIKDCPTKGNPAFDKKPPAPGPGRGRGSGRGTGKGKGRA